MTLTIRVSATAAAAFRPLPDIGKRVIRRVLRELARDSTALAKHPQGTAIEEAPDGLRLYAFLVGNLKLILVGDEGDLVLIDILPWDAPL